MSKNVRYWADMSTIDFAGSDVERKVVILPVSSIEQHGPHLPVCTDGKINEAILDATLEQLSKDTQLTIMPPLPYGFSPEHMGFNGTISLSSQTIIALWTQICEAVHKVGLRKLVIFNSHGGQPAIADIVARDLRERLHMMVMPVSYDGLADLEDIFSADEVKYGIHAGAVETSMMLHIDGRLVRQKSARKFVPSSYNLDKQYQYVKPKGHDGYAWGYAWQAQDLHKEGAAGDASAATPEQGREVIKQASKAFAKLLDEFSKFPLRHIQDDIAPPRRRLG